MIDLITARKVSFYLKRDERKNQLLTWRKIGFP